MPKVDEGRDVYVSDGLYWLVYECGDRIVRDCLDLALLCGLRPSEALGTKWADLRKGADGSEELWIKLPKTSKSGVKIKRVRVVGNLKDLLDRVRARGIVGQTILCDEKGQKLLLQGKFGRASTRRAKRRRSTSTRSLKNLRPKSCTNSVSSGFRSSFAICVRRQRPTRSAPLAWRKQDAFSATQLNGKQRSMCATKSASW
jgi:integrase